MMLFRTFFLAPIEARAATMVWFIDAFTPKTFRAEITMDFVS